MEIEVKIRVKSIEDFEKRIEPASFLREEEQKDTYFKVPEGELLRVREIGNGGAFLGHKRIRDGENTLFDEVEARVEDGEKVVDILKSLGFEELVAIKRCRRIYEQDGITMELNKVKGIGDFVDFEIISEDASEKERILELIKKLGYLGDIEPRLYTELALR
jgi:adenylate cyclase class 2